MITPIPRRRPWKLAKELITLDHLSEGRIILGAGIGNPDVEYSLFSENPSLKTRAKKLDEGLEIIDKMCIGESFSYDGNQYTILEEKISPGSVQKPRITTGSQALRVTRLLLGGLLDGMVFFP